MAIQTRRSKAKILKKMEAIVEKMGQVESSQQAGILCSTGVEIRPKMNGTRYWQSTPKAIFLCKICVATMKKAKKLIFYIFLIFRA
jgi:hypothetical protein